MKSEEDIFNKLEFDRQLLDFIEAENPKRPKLIAWIETLEWVLDEQKKAKEDSREEKGKKAKPKLIDDNSMLGRMLNK